MAKEMTLFGDIENVAESAKIEPMALVPELDKIEPKEIVPGLSVEEMKAVFFDKNALIEPSYRVFQLNSKGHRYYYKYDEQGEPIFYPSVTTILAQTLPKSPFLVSWIADKGEEEAERYKAERAAYGTFMHAQFEDLLINRTYDLDSLKSRLKSRQKQRLSEQLSARKVRPSSR